MSTAVAQVVLTGELLRDAARVIGLALLSGVISTVVALVYRWYSHDRVPGGVAVLAGLGGVAISLNTQLALSQVIEGPGAEILSVRVALANVVTFLLAGGAALLGARIGDRLGRGMFTLTGVREIDSEVGVLVQAVGRVITVELPDADDINDVEHYDPVDPGTKAKLGGKTLVFPRRLTVDELRERLVDRLRSDYSVGFVDVDLTEEGEVEYLALGTRLSGIGPTLPPGSAAVALQADPPYAASPGDSVQVWRATHDNDETHERVTVAELRGRADDVVTLAVDADDVDDLSPADSYRLVTLPATARPDREFASLLRAAEETMGVVTVEAGATLVGTPVGALDVPIVAVRTPDGTVETLPPRSRVLDIGESMYVVARPDALRRLEAGATVGLG